MEVDNPTNQMGSSFKASSEAAGQIPPLKGGLPDNYGISRGVYLQSADKVNEIANKTKALAPAKLKAFVNTLLEADDDTYRDKLETAKNVPSNDVGSDLSKVAIIMARAGRFKEQWKDSWDKQIDERTKDMVLDALHVADIASRNSFGIINAVEATGRQNEPRIANRLAEFKEIYETNKGARDTLITLERQRALGRLGSFLGG